MARRQTTKDTTPTEMLRTLSEKLRTQAREPNILAYRPHSKQLLFHKSPARRRLYIGGNRSGKTVGGITEDIYYMKGKHPFKKIFEPPTRGRIVSTDFTYGINQVIIPKLKQWLPPSMLIKGSWYDSYSSEFKELTLTNGSTVELMTYEQDPDKFAGTSRHWTHYDEEPPKPIYTECQARLIDTAGYSWLTMTPLDGMTWVYDELYLPGKEGQNSSIFVVEIDIHENPYITKEAIEEYVSTLDEDERVSREKGQFVQLGGKVYKHFSIERHVIPIVNPKELKSWEWYRSMDHGFNNPTAWLWHAVAKDGTIVTFAEHYARELTVQQHSEIVHSMDSDLGKEPEYCVGDPATAQRQGVTGTSIAAEYAIRGIFITPGNNDVLTGVNQIQSYLNVNPVTGKPYWQITENCVNLIKELQRLRWRTYSSKKAQSQNNAQEQIHKFNDHAADSARYFFTLMPDLKPIPQPVNKLVPQRKANERYDEVLARMHLDKEEQQMIDSPTAKWRLGTNPVEWDF